MTLLKSMRSVHSADGHRCIANRGFRDRVLWDNLLPYFVNKESGEVATANFEEVVEILSIDGYRWGRGKCIIRSQRGGNCVCGQSVKNGEPY